MTDAGAQGQQQERKVSETKKMENLHRDLTLDAIKYTKITRAISDLQKRIADLEEVLQEATKNIVNITRPSHESMMAKLTEAKKCKNEAIQIKRKSDIMDPVVQSRITTLLTKSAAIIEELVKDTDETSFNIHEAQNSIFNLSINSMVAIELVRQIVKETTNGFEYLLEGLADTMKSISDNLSNEIVERCIPDEDKFDKVIRQMQINMDIVNAMMEKITTSGDDVRRLQASAELSIERKPKKKHPARIMEFVEIGKIIAEKCGVSILTTASTASTRFEQATQRLFNSRELTAESSFHRIISKTHAALPCFDNVTYPENNFGNARIPYNVNDLVTIHESLTREYNSLRVAYKSLMAICEIQLRRVDNMSTQILQMQESFFDYMAKIREINICSDLLLLTEQSKRIRYGDRLDEIIVLMDIHRGDVDDVVTRFPETPEERIAPIAVLNATTLQTIQDVLNHHVNQNACRDIHEGRYESYFNSDSSVPTISLQQFINLGSSPTGSDYETPDENREDSHSPKSPPSDARERSLSPQQLQRAQNGSPPEEPKGEKGDGSVDQSESEKLKRRRSGKMRTSHGSQSAREESKPNTIDHTAGAGSHENHKRSGGEESGHRQSMGQDKANEEHAASASASASVSASISASASAPATARTRGDSRDARPKSRIIKPPKRPVSLKRASNADRQPQRFK